jgi:hypothetical protein
MIRFRLWIVVLAVATFALGTGSAAEQTPPPPPARAQQTPPPPPPPSPPPAKVDTPPPPPQALPPPARAPAEARVSSATRNVQVDVKVTLRGTGTPVTKQMSLVAADGEQALGRSGIDVPVPSGGSFTYRGVGTNVDARPRILEAGKIGLNLKLNFSAVLKVEGQDAARPSFGNATVEMYLVLESGRPLVMTQAADGEIGREFNVEVKATILK